MTEVLPVTFPGSRDLRSFVRSLDVHIGMGSRSWVGVFSSPTSSRSRKHPEDDGLSPRLRMTIKCPLLMLSRHCFATRSRSESAFVLLSSLSFVGAIFVPSLRARAEKDRNHKMHSRIQLARSGNSWVNGVAGFAAWPVERDRLRNSRLARKPHRTQIDRATDSRSVGRSLAARSVSCYLLNVVGRRCSGQLESGRAAG